MIVVHAAGRLSTRSQLGGFLRHPLARYRLVPTPARVHPSVSSRPADLVNPPHRLAVGREHQDGTVVDDDLHVALDAYVVVPDRVAGLGVAVGAAEYE